MSKWRRDRDRQHIELPQFVIDLLNDPVTSPDDYKWIVSKWGKEIPFNIRARLINRYRRRRALANLQNLPDRQAGSS